MVTRLQRPNEFIINNGAKDLSYPIVFKKKVRQWRTTKIRIQDGQGELVKVWDSWHSGMGWSRDESRDARYAPPVYEDATGNLGITATHRGFIYPMLDSTTITLGGSPSSVDRIAEMGGYIYMFSTDSSDIRVHKIDPTDDSLVYERTLSSWPAPAGQPAEFGGYLYVPSAGEEFKELTTIVADLTAAWHSHNGTYTDNTTAANASGGTAFTVLDDTSGNGDYFYWGAATKFDGLYFDIDTVGAGITAVWEFWNGAAWTDIIGPETDSTSNFTQDGWVDWLAASQTDWAAATPTAVSMGGSPPDDVSRFWVRVSSAAISGNPTAAWTPPSDVWTDGPKVADATRRYAWHFGTAGKLLWRVGDNSDPATHHVINSCSAQSTGGTGGPLTSGNWSDTADYVIGKPGRNINSLAELGRWLYVGKEEGLFGSDDVGNQTNALDFVRNLIASTNCQDTIRWLGTLVTVHKTGLWQHTGVSSFPIGVETLESNLGAVKGGRYTALATAGQWLYVAYLVGTKTHLLACRPGHEDEPPIVWHVLFAFASVTINAMLVSGLTTNPYLWLGNDNALPKYIPLAQDGSPDPSDSNIAFTSTNSYCVFPGVDWGMPGTKKRGHMVEIVTSQATGTGGSVAVAFGWEGATPSTALGSGITTTGLFQRFWTAGTNDEGYRLQLRVVTQGGANSLRIDKVSLYCIALPRMEDGIEVIVRLADSRVRTRKTMWDDLDALVNAGVYDVRDPDDPLGGTFKAIVHNLEPTKGEQLGDAAGEEYVTVTLRKVLYS